MVGSRNSPPVTDVQVLLRNPALSVPFDWPRGTLGGTSMSEELEQSWFLLRELYRKLSPEGKEQLVISLLNQLSPELRNTRHTLLRLLETPNQQ